MQSLSRRELLEAYRATKVLRAKESKDHRSSRGGTRTQGPRRLSKSMGGHGDKASALLPSFPPPSDPEPGFSCVSDSNTNRNDLSVHSTVARSPKAEQSGPEEVVSNETGCSNDVDVGPTEVWSPTAVQTEFREDLADVTVPCQPESASPVSEECAGAIIRPNPKGREAFVGKDALVCRQDESSAGGAKENEPLPSKDEHVSQKARVKSIRSVRVKFEVPSQSTAIGKKGLGIQRRATPAGSKGFNTDEEEDADALSSFVDRLTST